ncbi:DUF1513 domain-containing protein [Methylocella sp.]|uniref:DUF1513 domain-containing protein n=1 Tax=Methylocella sp. TaxID=1978226 RepID=UPI0037846DC6
MRDAFRPSRRALVTGALATGAALACAPRGLPGSASAFAAPRPETAVDGFIATAGVEEGFAALAYDAALDETARLPSAARLHGLDAHGSLAVAVGRRPGHVALVFDARSGRLAATFAPAPGRAFSGHGRFSQDGETFLVNEIERPRESEGPGGEMGRGVVSLRRVDAGFAIVGEWPSGGDGPHDLLRAGALLAVANGGIEPNTPEARDAEVTGSSLALLDPRTGAQEALGRLGADLASLSLRHLARGSDGALAVAAQDLLKDGEARPLAFAVGPDGALKPFEAPDDEWRALRGYVGSIAYDRSGGLLACASPRGGRVAVWRADGRYLGAVPLPDGCALAPAAQAGRFLAASGYGETILIGVEDGRVGALSRRTGGPRFDNHMIAV